MTLARLRRLILFLLFLSTVINYVDRQALSVLLPTLRGELGTGCQWRGCAGRKTAHE